MGRGHPGGQWEQARQEHEALVRRMMNSPTCEEPASPFGRPRDLESRQELWEGYKEGTAEMGLQSTELGVRTPGSKAGSVTDQL